MGRSPTSLSQRAARQAMADHYLVTNVFLVLRIAFDCYKYRFALRDAVIYVLADFVR